MSRLRIYALLEREGPLRGTDIAKRLCISRHNAHQALRMMRRAGQISLSGSRWWRIYSVNPAIPPPISLRGQMPGSLRALSWVREAKIGNTRKFAPCLLAQLWSVSVDSAADGDRLDTRVPEVRPEFMHSEAQAKTPASEAAD